MSITVTGRKMPVTDALREYAEDKIGNSMKVMDINPLDQPAVELGKRLANTRLGASGYPREAADLAEFLAVAQEPESF